MASGSINQRMKHDVDSIGIPSFGDKGFVDPGNSIQETLDANPLGPSYPRRIDRCFSRQSLTNFDQLPASDSSLHDSENI